MGTAADRAAGVTPRPPRMRAQKGFGHTRIWWLLNDKGGWLTVYAGSSKNTQSRDIAQARKRVTEVKTRGCDYG